MPLRRFAFYFALLTLLSCQAYGQPAKPVQKPIVKMSAMQQELTRGKVWIIPLPGFPRPNFKPSRFPRGKSKKGA